MGDRVVYGHTHSENGWPMVDEGSCEWVRVLGTNPHVTLQIREGQPAKIMGAFAADYNAYIEPLRDADSACYTTTNSVPTSNHLSATGMDLNWNGPDGKTFRLGIPKSRAYPGAKAAALDELLKFYEGMIFCGGEWDIQDWMHFQMGGNTYGRQNFERVESFIRRKIRPDGFSTFRRGGETPAPPVTPAPPKVKRTAVDVLYDAVPVIDEARAAELLPLISEGLKAAACTNVKRIAMWLAQIGHESDGFRATEEYQSGDESTDRWRYKGRTWIQITWRSNYEQFSWWCFNKGLVSTPQHFVNNPRDLAQPRWASLGPAWYWTVARANINTMCDAGDMLGVTRAINGGTNGLDDRQKRYDQAIGLGDELLMLIQTDTPTEEGPLMALTDAEQKELLQKTREVWDQLRGPAAKGWPQLADRTPVDAIARMLTILESGVAVPTVDEISYVLRAAFAQLGRVEDES